MLLSGIFLATRCVASECRRAWAPFEQCWIPDLRKARATIADTAPAVSPFSNGKFSAWNSAPPVRRGRYLHTYVRSASRA